MPKGQEVRDWKWFV